MSSLKLIHIKVASKDFHKQRQVTDKFMIHANNILYSAKLPCNMERIGSIL